MAETSVSIILTIWLLRLHHVGPDETEMSPVVRRVVLGWLARLVGSATDQPRTRRPDADSARDKLTTSHSAGQADSEFRPPGLAFPGLAFAVLVPCGLNITAVSRG